MLETQFTQPYPHTGDIDTRRALKGWPVTGTWPQRSLRPDTRPQEENVTVWEEGTKEMEKAPEEH